MFNKFAHRWKHLCNKRADENDDIYLFLFLYDYSKAWSPVKELFMQISPENHVDVEAHVDVVARWRCGGSFNILL